MTPQLVLSGSTRNHLLRLPFLCLFPFLFLFLHPPLSASRTATYFFLNLKLMPDLAQNQPFRFFLNGTELPAIADGEYQNFPPIHYPHWDTLRVIHHGITETALLRIHPWQIYVIRLNPCSYWEVMPAVNAHLGAVRFYSPRHADTLTVGLGSDLHVLPPGQHTVWIPADASAMCPFSAKEIVMGDVRVKVHFLHGEKVRVRVRKGRRKTLDIRP